MKKGYISLIISSTFKQTPQDFFCLSLALSCMCRILPRFPASGTQCVFDRTPWTSLQQQKTRWREGTHHVFQLFKERMKRTQNCVNDHVILEPMKPTILNKYKKNTHESDDWEAIPFVRFLEQRSKDCIDDIMRGEEKKRKNTYNEISSSGLMRKHWTRALDIQHFGLSLIRIQVSLLCVSTCL